MAQSEEQKAKVQIARIIKAISVNEGNKDDKEIISSVCGEVEDIKEQYSMLKAYKEEHHYVAPRAKKNDEAKEDNEPKEKTIKIKEITTIIDSDKDDTEKIIAIKKLIKKIKNKDKIDDLEKKISLANTMIQQQKEIKERAEAKLRELNEL